MPQYLLDLQTNQYPLSGYRQKQLLEWVFKHNSANFGDMKNLPAAQRQELTKKFSMTGFLKTESFPSTDGSVKYLYTLLDGKQTEAVLMPYQDRTTICVSTMVGCPAGCTFCATGKLGFGRNLSPGEIVEQILQAARLANIPVASIRNLVFMGMGEPLLNYDNTLNAARILLAPEALGMSQRRVTLSTVGLPEKIVRLSTEDISLRLAISLHAPDEETRQSIIPTAHAHKIADIMASAREYQAVTGRRISFEYAMLKNINDHLEQAEMLSELLRGLIAHVNLIPMNPWKGSNFESSSETRIQEFMDVLANYGVPVSVRRSRGRDAGAACGQLALQRPAA